MKAFATLFDRLSFEPSRNGKLRLLTSFFRDEPDRLRFRARLCQRVGGTELPRAAGARADRLRETVPKPGNSCFYSWMRLSNKRYRYF